jgi:hypothetical protein
MSVCRKNYFHFTSQAEIERGIAVQVDAALTRRDLTHTHAFTLVPRPKIGPSAKGM